MQEWLLEQWQRHKKTILFITHDVEEAIFLSGSVLAVEPHPHPHPDGDPRARRLIPGPGNVLPSRRWWSCGSDLIDVLRKQVTAMKRANRGNLPALIFLFALLMLWQLGAMEVNAAYILPTPLQILQKLWELGAFSSPCICPPP